MLLPSLLYYNTLLEHSILVWSWTPPINVTCKRRLDPLRWHYYYVYSEVIVLSFFSLFFNCLQIQGVRGGTAGQSVRIIYLRTSILTSRLAFFTFAISRFSLVCSFHYISFNCSSLFVVLNCCVMILCFWFMYVSKLPTVIKLTRWT